MTMSNVSLARIAVLFVFVALPSVAVVAQQSARSPKEVALGLARSGKAVGVVLSSSDFEGLERAARSGPPEPLEHDDVILFERTHPEWLVQEIADTVRLIRRDAPTEIVELLNRPRYLPEAVRMSASAGLVHVVGAILMQREPGGVLGSGPAPSEKCPLNDPVVFADGPASGFDLLGSIVRQAHGLAWLVIYDQHNGTGRFDLGLWCEDGMYFRVELTRALIRGE